MAGATGSLLNMTVPLDSGLSGQGLLMPKLKYRFRILFVGFGAGSTTTELTKQVMTITRPSADFEDQVIDVYNSKIHYAGKVKWDPLSIELRDDVNGSVSALVGQQMQRQFDFLNQASASASGAYKFELIQQVLDGGNGTVDPVVLEEWDIVGAYIQKVSYGDNDYKSSEPLTIKLDVVFDNALQSGNSAGGIGTVGTRTSSSILI
jgi:hypothetical protein